ncbi:hypothetical protein MTR67_010262 [Solanum verrucosum]|uniref:Core Histone H2A/H2B/H3 domain-containing protein n=1 Tax=Solanum verrucosum TaxID=315347 RepID=A0AAF0Q5V5_SOLVR|nr:hypothetical protein MTR67_010262 [Solanum verrucosum]
MDFNSSFMELPKSSSALSSEMQRPIHMDSSMPSDKKIQQDEDERDPSFMQLLKENLFSFWKRQKEEILRSDPKRKHDLPISRIRRAMKSNDQVKMVSAYSTVLFLKAIEMFIMELTLRAWMQADQGKCRTLKRYDFARAIGMKSFSISSLTSFHSRPISYNANFRCKRRKMMAKEMTLTKLIRWFNLITFQ